MSFLTTTVVYMLGRYVHIVCATLLVGGTLFYEMVVPIAIDDLRQEQKLSVFARARWVFRWIVWIATALILLSGIINTRNHWQEYSAERYGQVDRAGAPQTPQEIPPAGRAGWWWVAHVSTGAVAVLVALSLTIGSVPPARPIPWMRLNLVILLLVMFLATATRQARLGAAQRHAGGNIYSETAER